MKNFYLAGLVCLLCFCQIRDKDIPAGTGIPEFSFAYLTDIHLQPELGAVEGFQKSIEKVNELNPDFVITGGDLIMDALGVSFERADSLYDMYLEQMEGFNMPVYNTLGNHEIYGLYEESGSDTTHEEYGKKMYEKRLGERYYSFDHKGWHFMILDAVGMTPERKYIGHIDEAQIEWIKSDLEKLDPDMPIVVSVHIPFITSYTQITRGTTAASGPGTVITNGTDVLRLFLPYNLKLVLQGHLHFLEDIYVNNQIHFITGGAVSGRWWKGPPSAEVEEGFLMVKAGEDQFQWEYIDYGWDVVEE
jgi:3',5'-cyclic AMP phosphodiesterase CpdA